MLTRRVFTLFGGGVVFGRLAGLLLVRKEERRDEDYLLGLSGLAVLAASRESGQWWSASTNRVVGCDRTIEVHLILETLTHEKVLVLDLEKDLVGSDEQVYELLRRRFRESPAKWCGDLFGIT